MERLLQGLGGFLATLCFFAFLGYWFWWIFWGSFEARRERDDPVYAEKLFSELVPISEVLESRQWHARGAEPWDCTFAIVRMTSDVPREPPTRSRDTELGWMFAFGGHWRATPEPEVGEDTRRALQFCSKYWPEALGKQLQQALLTPGAWYDRGPVGETLYIYAPIDNLAARIRFGD